MSFDALFRWFLVYQVESHYSMWKQTQQNNQNYTYDSFIYHYYPRTKSLWKVVFTESCCNAWTITDLSARGIIVNFSTAHEFRN